MMKKQAFLDIKTDLAKNPEFTPEKQPSTLANIGNAIKNLFVDIGKIIFQSPFKDPFDQVEEKAMEKHKTLAEESANISKNNQLVRS